MNHRVIGVTNRFIAIEKEDKTIVLVPILRKNGKLQTDLENMVYIKFPDDAISGRSTAAFEIIDF